MSLKDYLNVYMALFEGEHYDLSSLVWSCMAYFGIVWQGPYYLRYCEFISPFFAIMDPNC